MVTRPGSWTVCRDRCWDLMEWAAGGQSWPHRPSVTDKDGERKVNSPRSLSEAGRLEISARLQEPGTNSTWGAGVSPVLVLFP